MKNPSTENVRRGWCRVVGIVKTGLLAACAVAATNIRLLRTWSETHAPAGLVDPLCAADPPDHGFEELTEAESLALADRLIPDDVGPPTAGTA